MKAPKTNKKKGALPSGNVRVQVYDYTDDSGKRHYKSFTAPTRKEAKLLADQWRITKTAKKSKKENEWEDITISEAVQRYIDIKDGVLSPATVREYIGMHQRHFSSSFGGKRLSEVSNPAIQLWISDLSRKLSPKSVRNIFGLLSATLEMFIPEYRITVKLPQKTKPELYCPSDDDVKKLLDAIRGTDLEIAVLLAAFGPLRRGEICALTDNDIHGNIIQVRRDMVQGADKQWYIKTTKTESSLRDVEMPDFVVRKIAWRRGRIVPRTPDYITHTFRRKIKALDIDQFRFHDLRHYAASIMHAIGVPDKYIMQRGGWASDNILKSVYQTTIDSENIKQTKKIKEYFEYVNKGE